jgi:uncharacterized membrane protein
MGAMNPWTLAFVGIGIVLALIGGATVLFNWGQEDQGMRQSGWIFFVAGLAMAVMTLFATQVPLYR